VEFTVDSEEKAALSQLAHAKFLGQIFTARLASAPAVAGVMPVSVSLKDAEPDAVIQTRELFSLGVFDDADLTLPSVDVALATPTVGDLLLGSGTGLIVARTAATGEFACSATCPTPGVTRYLATAQTMGGGIIDCRMIRTLVYP